MGRRPLEWRMQRDAASFHGLESLIAGLGMSLWIPMPRWWSSLHDRADALHHLRVATRARQLVGRVCVDSFGVLESIDAVDLLGRVRCRLLRVPDSDYLGWELALARLPVRREQRNALPGAGMQGALVRPRLADEQLVLDRVDHCSVATCTALQRWSAARA